MMSCLVLCRSPSDVGYSMIRPVSVNKESDNNDYDEIDNIVQANNMQVATKGDENDIQKFENVYANNEYVEHEYPYPDEFQGDY